MSHFHIPFSPAGESSYSAPLKQGSCSVSISEKIWQLIRFTVVTGIFFVIAFTLINFQAYKQIVLTVFNKQGQANTQATLETVAGVRKVYAKNLLPVLPDQRDVREKFDAIAVPVVPPDARIIIPKIGKNVPIVEMGTEQIEGEDWSKLEKQIQSGLQKGIVHYPGTSKPGQFGNVFLTGHSSYYPWDPGRFKDVFALLGRLDVGDEFYVYYDQKAYTYRITSKSEVQPNNVTVLEQPTDKKIATLMTCTPVGTTLRRLIIRAEQV